MVYINNKCINKCSVVEVYHKLTDTLLFNTNNNENFEIINETSLYDYKVSLDLIQERYSHEDMEGIFEEIKFIYEFESDKELVK